MQERTSESAPKRKHLGVIIRVVVYGTALSYFGWQAAQRFLTEREIADENFRTSLEQWLQHPPKTIIMPNGESMPVLELTEDEAKQMGLLPASAERAKPADPEPAEPADSAPAEPIPTPAPDSAPAPAQPTPAQPAPAEPIPTPAPDR